MKNKAKKKTAYNKHPNNPVGRQAPVPKMKNDKYDAYDNDDKRGPLEEGSGPLNEGGPEVKDQDEQP